MGRSDYRAVHGILLLDKPLGSSSNQALQHARRRFRAAKAGHTGSLDPLATGLLPICFGEATKIAGLLLGSRKAYETECRLGVTTATDDAEGAIVLERPVATLDEAEVRAALAGLTGRIRQVPPVYSALKRDGEPLYRLARRGEIVDVAPREVEVHRLELLETRADRLQLHVECGSGTYVRSLVRDLGERLGCGAHVTALRRLWVEPFHEPRMHGLDELDAIAAAEGQAGLDRLLIPLEEGLAGYPAVRVGAADAARLRHGQAVASGAAPGRYVALGEGGRAVALVECGHDGRVRPLRGFNGSADPVS